MSDEQAVGLDDEATNYEVLESNAAKLRSTRSTYLLSENMEAVRLNDDYVEEEEGSSGEEDTVFSSAAPDGSSVSPRAIGSQVAKLTEAEIEQYENDDFQVVTLHARTLAGDAVTIPEIPYDILVSDLKFIVAAQLPKFPMEEQKLILRGKTLDDDEKLIADYGVKDGDTIHVVRQLRGHSVASEMASPKASSADLEYGASDEVGPAIAAAERPQVFDVLVPPGRVPGDRLRINLPERGAMVVVVPPGYFANSTFKITVAPQTQGEAERVARDNRAKARAQARGPPPRGPPKQEVRGNSSLAPAQRKTNPFAAAPRGPPRPSRGPPRLMEVVVPPDARPGQNIEVMVGHHRMRVVVPGGVKPGETFRFRLPDGM